MKKFVKKVLGFVSLLFVLPFVIPAGLLVLAGLYMGQMLAGLVVGYGKNRKPSDENQRIANGNKWSNVTDSLSWNCLN